MSENIQVAEEREKSSGRNWTEEEKDLVWEHACKAKAEGQPLTEAFRTVSRLLPHRSEAAIGMLYYNVLRKERAENAAPSTEQQKKTPSPKAEEKTIDKVKPGKEKRSFTIDSEIIEAFQGLPEYIQKLHRRMDQLEAQIAKPSKSAIADAIVDLVSGYQQANTLNAETAKLQARIAELEKENATLKEQLKHIQQSYEDAITLYDMFTNMASISQIMSLGDFKQQMKTTLDKWGNVLKVSFERAE